MKKSPSQLSTQETVRRALLTRRSLMKSAVAIGAVGLSAPLITRNAFSSSGELNIIMWSDEFPGDVIPNFEKASGIKVNQTPFSQNEEQINKLQATGGDGFDLCQPTRDRAPQFKDLAVLAPFDLKKVNNIGNLIPSMLEGSSSVWTWEDGLYHLPHCWGTEAISFRTDLYKGDIAALSFGSLWDESVKGHVQGRPHSLLLGIGLWRSRRLPKQESKRPDPAPGSPQDMIPCQLCSLHFPRGDAVEGRLGLYCGNDHRHRAED